MTAKLRGQGWPANIVTRRPPRIRCADLPKQPDADQPRAAAVELAGVNQPPVTEVA